MYLQIELVQSIDLFEHSVNSYILLIIFNQRKYRISPLFSIPNHPRCAARITCMALNIYECLNKLTNRDLCTHS